MKKVFPGLLSAVCLLVWLTACAPPAPPDAGGASSDDAPPPAAQSDVPAPAPAAPSLHMEMALSPTDGRGIAGSEAGAYALVSGTEDWSGRLIYYDYATRQLIWLSDQLIVTNDEENPGWIEDTFGGAVPMAANGQLYVLQYGKAPVPGIGYEGSPSRILRMEPNAANRRTLTVPQGKLLRTGSGVAADGEELYLILADYDAGAMEMTGLTLCRTDFAGGSCEPLLSLGAPQEAAILGVYPEGLILRRAALPDAYKNAAAVDQLPHLHYELLLYSIPEGKLTGAGFTWAQGDLTLTVGEGTVYSVRSGESRLRAYDLLTNAERVLTDDLLAGFAHAPDAAVFLPGALYDGRLLFSVSTGEGSAGYSVSLSTGEILPCALTFAHEGGQMPVSIVAENGEYFLVHSGFLPLRLSATGTDGSVYTYDSYEPRYALMKKEDYWNSVPDYIPFDDSLFQSLSVPG